MNTKKEGNANMKNFKVDKELLRNEYRKVWGKSERMVDYCTNQAAAMTTLPTGEIVIIEKQKVETDFCFGESGYDYEDAQGMAHHARTSEDYLKAKNMEKFNEWVHDLEAVNINGMTDDLPTYILAIGTKYSRCEENTNIVALNWIRLTDFLDAMGGSYRLEDMPGTKFTHWNVDYRVATKEEIDTILDLYKYAREKHEKKVDGYIKRYGTTKVNAWTYWRDA